MHVVATAGHVDHGKSTLVRALTGMEPDRWEEERRRGLTIDLGYAWTALPSGRDVAFVDVPGHERFLGNMLAGLGPAPVVCFVVAADEGIRPGTTVETLANLAGTPYGDLAAFGREHAADGLIVYLEAAGDDAGTICRNLHGLRLAGWFEHAKVILVGRTNAPDAEGLSQREAVLDALGRLELPIVFDLEIGHVPPHLPLVNGALATLTVDEDTREVVQRLC